MSDSNETRRTAIIDGSNVARYWANQEERNSGSDKAQIKYIQKVGEQLAAYGFGVRLAVDDSLISLIKDDPESQKLLETLIARYAGIVHHHADEPIVKFLEQDPENHLFVSNDELKNFNDRFDENQRIRFLVVQEGNILLYTGLRFRHSKITHTLLSPLYTRAEIEEALRAIFEPLLKVYAITVSLVPVWHFKHWIVARPSRRGRSYAKYEVNIDGEEALYVEAKEVVTSVAGQDRFLEYLSDNNRLKKSVRDFSLKNPDILSLSATSPDGTTFEEIRNRLSDYHKKQVHYSDGITEEWQPPADAIAIADQIVYLVPYYHVSYSIGDVDRAIDVNAVTDSINKVVEIIEAEAGQFKKAAEKRQRQRLTKVLGLIFTLIALAAIGVVAWLVPDARSLIAAFFSIAISALFQLGFCLIAVWILVKLGLLFFFRR